MIADHLNGRLPGLVGPGDRRWSYAFVEDVAAGHALALEKGRAGERYLLGGENATLERLFAAASRRSPAWRRRACHIPYARRHGARPRAVALGGADRPPAAAHPRRGVTSSASTGPTTARKAERELGYEWRPLAEGLRETVRWLRATGQVARRERGLSLTRGELARKLVHVGCGAFALLLRCPHAGRRPRSWRSRPSSSTGRCCRASAAAGIWREADVARGYPVGILALSARRARRSSSSSATALWMAAAVWGILAFGDGMAVLVGQATGRPAPAVEPAQGLGRASLAFVRLRQRWPPPSSRRGPLRAAARPPARPTGRARSAWRCALALVCALVESLPTTLDDNVTVPLAAALALPLLAAARARRCSSDDPGLPRRAAGRPRGERRDRAAGLPGALDRRRRARSRRSSSAPRSPPGSACPASR